MFESFGYEACPDNSSEEGLEKIAIYAVGDRVKHAARQLIDGQWTSKLGTDVDITHSSLAELEDTEFNAFYGKVVLIMKRQR